MLSPSPYPGVGEFGEARIGVDYYRVTEWHLFDEPYFQTTAVLAGWPADSMWGYQAHVYKVVDDKLVIIDESESWILAGAEGRRLPYLPIWPGFAINTLFYATLLWLPICGPFVLRRFLRVRRGLCPKVQVPHG